jgi:hypothetical protein
VSVLESAVVALREDAPAPDGGARADATRARLVRSLERRAHHHRQLVTVVTLLVLVLGATASWAWTTGRLQQLFGSASPQREEPPVPDVPAPRAPARPPVEKAAPQPETWPTPSEAVLPPPPVAKRAPAARPPARPTEVLYRRAHELHFHGDDRAAALAAWDAYLAAESTGTFAVEARFNRAIVLVRLARYDEAIAALEPFARGEIAGAGYRRDEAEQLVARLRTLVVTP